MEILNILQDSLIGSWWVFSGVAHALGFVVIIKLLIYGYKEHAYLYQFDNRSEALNNAVLIILPYVKRLKLKRYRQKINLYLARSGMRTDWTCDHFIGSQLIYAIVAFLGSYLFLSLILGMSFIFPVLITLVAFVYPYIKLADQAALRYESCRRDLPFFIDYLTLSMSAGLDFNQGLATVISDAPNSPLKDELSNVLRDMRLGSSREQALGDLQKRMDSPGLKLFTQTLLQAMRMGSDVVQTLTVISETLQNKRFQAAEESAGKISVKIMIPMMVFVMPATLIILLGPMMLEWVQRF